MYFWETFYQYLEENYFSASVQGQYEHLNFTKTNVTLLVIFGGLLLGMMIAAVAAILQKNVVGGFIRSLLRSGAKDEDTAKTLDELGYGKNAMVKSELSRLSVARKLTAFTEDGQTYISEEELRRAYFPETEEKLPESTKTETAAEERPSEAVPAESSAEETAPASAVSEPPEAKKPRSKRGKSVLKKPDFGKARFFIPEKLRVRAEVRYDAKGNSAWLLIPAFLAFLLLFFLLLRFTPVFVRMLDNTIGNIVG